MTNKINVADMIAYQAESVGPSWDFEFEVGDLAYHTVLEEVAVVHAIDDSDPLHHQIQVQRADSAIRLWQVAYCVPADHRYGEGYTYGEALRK